MSDTLAARPVLDIDIWDRDDMEVETVRCLVGHLVDAAAG